MQKRIHHQVNQIMRWMKEEEVKEAGKFYDESTHYEMKKLFSFNDVSNMRLSTFRSVLKISYNLTCQNFVNLNGNFIHK